MTPVGMLARLRHTAYAGLGLAAAVGGVATAVAASPAHDSGRRPDALVVIGDAPKQAIAAVAIEGAGAHLLRRFPTPGVRALAWNRNKGRAAILTAGTYTTNKLVLIDLSSGKRHVLADARHGDPAAFFGAVAWQPAGALLAVTRSANAFDADIELLDVITGKTTRRFAAGAELDSRLSWSRDGRSLVFAQQRTPRARPALRLLNVETGAMRPAARAAGLDPALSKRGALAFAASTGIRVLRSGRELTVAGTRRGDRSPSWSSDDKRLLFERPTTNCPRSYTTNICTHVLVANLSDGSTVALLRVPARMPASN